jgi:hypothetical protein
MNGRMVSLDELFGEVEAEREAEVRANDAAEYARRAALSPEARAAEELAAAAKAEAHADYLARVSEPEGDDDELCSECDEPLNGSECENPSCPECPAYEEGDDQ